MTRQLHFALLVTLLLSLLLPAFPAPVAADASAYLVVVDSSIENDAATGLLPASDPGRAKIGIRNRHKFWTNVVVQPPIGGVKLQPSGDPDDILSYLAARFGVIDPEGLVMWDATFDDKADTQQVITTTPALQGSNSLNAGMLNIIASTAIMLGGTGIPKGGDAEAAAQELAQGHQEAFAKNYFDLLTDDQQAEILVGAVKFFGFAATKEKVKRLLVVVSIVEGLDLVRDQLDAIAEGTHSGNAVFRTMPRPGDGWVKESHTFTVVIPRTFRFEVDGPKTPAEQNPDVRVFVDDKPVIDTRACGPRGTIALGFGRHEWRTEYRAGDRSPEVKYSTAFLDQVCADASSPPDTSAPPPMPANPEPTPSPSLHTVEWTPAFFRSDPSLAVSGGSSCRSDGTDLDLEVTYRGPISTSLSLSPQTASVGGRPLVQSIAYGDLDGDGIEEAVVSLQSVCEGGPSDGLIYHMTAAGPRIAATFLTPKRFGTRIENGLLELRTGIFAPDEGQCCPTMVRVTQYRLQEDELVAVGERVEQGLRPVNRTVTGGITGIALFSPYSLEVPDGWADQHQTTATTDTVTLSKNGYTVTIDQGARGYGQCSYNGSPPAQFSHVYGDYQDINGKSGGLRRSWDSDSTAQTTNYRVCQQQPGSMTYIDATAFGFISIVAPNPPGDAILVEADSILASATIQMPSMPMSTTPPVMETPAPRSVTIAGTVAFLGVGCATSALPEPLRLSSAVQRDEYAIINNQFSDTAGVCYSFLLSGFEGLYPFSIIEIIRPDGVRVAGREVGAMDPPIVATSDPDDPSCKSVHNLCAKKGPFGLIIFFANTGLYPPGEWLINVLKGDDVVAHGTFTTPASLAKSTPSLRGVNWADVFAHDPDLQVRNGSAICHYGEIDLSVTLKSNAKVNGRPVTDAIKYGDISGDGGEEAVIGLLTSCTGGVTNALIYRMTPNGPKLVASIPEEQSAIGVAFTIGTRIIDGQLEVTHAIYRSGDSHADPSGGK